MKLRIEKEVYGGDGLARLKDGRAVFVPYVLPGELVEVELAGDRAGATKANALRVEDASPARVEAGCRHFGQCGGCQYQHGSYEAQLLIKQDILSETLERAGLRDRPRIEVHFADPWGYRNRIRLRVEAIEGAIRFGYNLRETRDFLPIDECPIAAPLLWTAAARLLELGRSDKNTAQWLHRAAEVELFCTAEERSLQITLLMREERSAGFSEFCQAVKVLVPELAGAAAVMASAPGTRPPPRHVASWGKAGLEYTAAGRQYWVSRGGFFQVNRFLVDELVKLVTDGRRGLLAWDLFAGVGLFSRSLAERFEQVVAIEENATAIKDMAAAKVANLRGLALPVVEFLRKAAVERDRPDLVVMDPPRAGVGIEVCGLLAKMRVPQMVYVSCDPTTLARDLRVMVDSGYNLAELHLVDLFPQTFHLETVVVLRHSAW